MSSMRLLTLSLCAAAIVGCGASAADEENTYGMSEQQMNAGGTADRGTMAQDEMYDEETELGRDEYAQPGMGTGTEPGTQSGTGTGTGMGMGMGTGTQSGTGQSQVSMRKGDETTPIRNVVYRREGNRAQLMFFRDDVDCASVTETPTGDDALVATVEVEPGTDGMPVTGQLPPAQWTYQAGQTGGRSRSMRGQRGWVTITRVPDTERIEGSVTVATTVDDQRFELNGPFTATVCEVSATGVPTGSTGTRPNQGMQQPSQGAQPSQGMQRNQGMQRSPDTQPTEGTRRNQDTQQNSPR